MLHPSNWSLQFANEKQRTKFELLSSKLTCEQKFWHVDTFRILEMLDDVGGLFGNLGWFKYAKIKCMSYDRMMLKFLSSWHVDWADSYRHNEVLITFTMFNNDHKISLRDYNELLHHLIQDKAYIDVPTN